MPEVHGGEQLGPEQESRLNPLYNFLVNLVEKGVEIPHKVLSVVEGLEDDTGRESRDMVSPVGPGIVGTFGGIEEGESSGIAGPLLSDDAQGAVLGKSVSFEGLSHEFRDDESESAATVSQETGVRPVAAAIYSLHQHSIGIIGIIPSSIGIPRFMNFPT